MVAGIGNIFRAESLFRRGVDPFLPGTSLSREDLVGLWEENVALMNIGVRVGRIITTDPVDRPGVPDHEAWPHHGNYVYHRHGQPVCTAAPRFYDRTSTAARSTGARSARSGGPRSVRRWNLVHLMSRWNPSWLRQGFQRRLHM